MSPRKLISFGRWSTLLMLTVFSINTQASNIGVIKGKMVDREGPLAYGEALLYTVADSAFSDGVSSNEQGDFIIEKIESGTYYLQISYMGYDDKLISDIVIKETETIIEIGTITLKRGSVELAEMVVSGMKNVLDVKMDKKVFNVSKSLVSQGGDGLDVLRNVPSVDVDVDNNISLRGNQSVIVLVDGRRINMSAADYLAMFPASAIDKVEIITNPSAKYDPEGMSGIINIIMNKEDTKGFNIKPTQTVGYSKYPMANTSIAMNFRRNKLNVTANINRNYFKTWFSGVTSMNYDQKDTLGNYIATNYENTDDEGEGFGSVYYGKIGADYFLNKKNTLYISGSGWSGQNEFASTMHFEELFAGETLTMYSDRIALNGGDQNGYEVNGGWQKKFKNDDHTLEVDVEYGISNFDGTSQYDQQFFLPGGVEIKAASVKQNNTEDNYNLFLADKIDYVNPLSLTTEYEAGFHHTLRQSKASLFSETYDTLTGKYLPDVLLNNKFNYDQDVYAVYNTFGHEIKKFSYKLGLRAEQTYTEFHVVKTGVNFENDYFQLYPSLHLNYKFSRQESMQLSYSRRINRPPLEMLNPIADYSNPKFIQTGNSDLQPEYVHVLEFNYNKYWDKVTFNGSIFYRQVTNMFRRFLRVDPVTGISYVSFVNFSTGDLSGTELIFGYNPFKKWRTRTTFMGWQALINDEGFEKNLDLDNWGWSVNVISTHSYRQTWGIQFFGRYRSSMEIAQGIVTPQYSVDAAINKTFRKKRGNINLRVSDIFKTSTFTFESFGELDGYYLKTTRLWESRGVYLSISYRFGNMGSGPDHEAEGENTGEDGFTAPDMQ